MHYIKIQHPGFLLHPYDTDSKPNLFSVAEYHRWNDSPCLEK